MFNKSLTNQRKEILMRKKILTTLWITCGITLYNGFPFYEVQAVESESALSSEEADIPVIISYSEDSESVATHSLSNSDSEETLTFEISITSEDETKERSMDESGEATQAMIPIEKEEETNPISESFLIGVVTMCFIGLIILCLFKRKQAINANPLN